MNGFNWNLVTMTNLSWQPDLDGLSGPRYQALADALANDIASGTLAPGTRLPTHRDLAWHLGVTVGTVSRGYAEATRRGLIAGEVGRGTFVQADAGGSVRATPMIWPTSDAIGGNGINLATNAPPIAGQDKLFAEELARLAADPHIAHHLVYPPNLGRRDVRYTAAAWLSATTGMDIPPERVFVTAGAQNALMVAFNLVARPGDTILVERLTYPGIKAVARTMQARLSSVDMDEEGMIPEALEAALRNQPVKLICCVPTLQNPTGAVMGEERRRAIAAIADSHRVPILEDGIYDFLAGHEPGPIMRHAQTEGFFATSLSKSVSPALRCGFLIAPARMTDDATRLMAGSALHASLLMSELARRWMEDGRVALSEAAVRQEATARQALAAERLGRWELTAHPASFHTWLTLPDPWRPSEFARAAEARGVMVTPAESFAIGRDPAPFAVRLSLTGAMTRDDLQAGLDALAGLLDSAPVPYRNVV